MNTEEDEEEEGGREKRRGEAVSLYKNKSAEETQRKSVHTAKQRSGPFVLLRVGDCNKACPHAATTKTLAEKAHRRSTHPRCRTHRPSAAAVMVDPPFPLAYARHSHCYSC